jgi:tetratricopeptide (TPR) repeat protein
MDPSQTHMLSALVDYFATQPEDRQQDLRLAEQFAQRGLALIPADMPTAARRLLSWRLVSIYYAELRYPEAEALRARLLDGKPAPAARKDEFAQQREALQALVRKGDLDGALALARSTLDARQQAFYASGQAVGDADFALAKARQDGATAANALAELTRGSAQAHARENGERLRLAETQRYLGEILHAMGKLDEAATAYQQALGNFPAAGQLRSLDRAHTRSDLAMLYRTRGELAKALPLQQQVLDELLPMVGEDHPDVIEARNELALLRKMAAGSGRK